MKAQATTLMELVARFRLGEEQQSQQVVPIEARQRPASVFGAAAPAPIRFKPAPVRLSSGGTAKARSGAAADWKQF
jgi:hypothetical protein